MAISTGDIYADAMTDLQAAVEAGKEVRLTLPEMCFIFKKKWEPDGEDTRTDFADMVAYLEAQSWATGNVRFFVENHRQTVVFSIPIATEPA